MTFMEYTKKVNEEWDNLNDCQRMVVGFKFLYQYMIFMAFYEEVGCQRYRLN